jgi:WD40 repeat protein
VTLAANDHWLLTTRRSGYIRHYHADELIETFTLPSGIQKFEIHLQKFDIHLIKQKQLEQDVIIGCVSSDFNTFAWTDAAPFLKITNLNTNNTTSSIPCSHERDLTCIQYSPCLTNVVGSAGKDCTVRTYDIEYLSETLKLKEHGHVSSTSTFDFRTCL